MLTISCILFGNFILFNLFLGLISYTFDRTADEDAKTIADDQSKQAPKEAAKVDLEEKDLNDQMNRGDNQDKTQNNAAAEKTQIPHNLIGPIDVTSNHKGQGIRG